MRDNIKQKGFRELIDEIIDVIPYAKKAIIEQSNEDIKKGLKIKLLSFYIQKTIAHYSVGDSKETVKASLLETITAFEDGFHWKGFKNTYGGYDTMTSLISLGILCDIELEDFKRITAILQRDGANDRLLSMLIRYKQPDWQESQAPVIQKHPYAQAPGLSTAADIKQYLNKVWYRGHSDAYWHGMHKNLTSKI